jgi:hypothetical protein
VSRWTVTKRKLGLIEDCRSEWRKFSTWITAVAIAVFGALLASPELAMSAWQMLPDDLRSSVPYQDKIALGLFVAIFLAKFVRQKPKDGQG